ncbi:ribonuclease H-like domain-containing protein, partial [Lactifluus volemus]
KSSLWAHFLTTGQHYKENKSHLAAVCKYCMTNHMQNLKEEDAMAVLNGNLKSVRTDSELTEHALTSIPNMPICGQLTTMLGHLRRCPTIDPVIRVQALLDRETEKNVYQANKTTQESQTLPAASSSTPDANSGPTPAELQKALDERICRLFVSCDYSWNSAANFEWMAFIQDFCLPGLRMPDRRDLGGHILEGEATKAVQDVGVKTRGNLATGQCDGWKSHAKVPVVTSMMTVENKAYLVRTHDMRGQPKTGDRLYELTRDDISYMQNTFGVQVIAYCTDDGPDGKKMRRLLHEALIEIIVLVCWAHQVNLMVGDYLKANPDLKDTVNKALEVMKWFNNHSLAHDWLMHQENPEKTYEQLIGKPPGTHALTLFLPVVTRWLAYYLSLSRLLAVSPAMRSLCLRRHVDLARCAGAKAEDIRKANTILALVNDSEFWTKVYRICVHLEPLAIAANVAQASHTRLDHVLLMLGNLFRIYSDPSVE